MKVYQKDGKFNIHFDEEDRKDDLPRVLSDAQALIHDGKTLLENLEPSLKSQSFILLTQNDYTSAAVILAASVLKKICILLPSTRQNILESVINKTQVYSVIEVFNDGSLHWKHHTSNHQQQCSSMDIPRWIKGGDDDDELLKNGGLCLATSGTVGVPKLVVFTWDAMRLQGDVCGKHLFPENNRQTSRLICVSSIAHGYAVAGLFMLLQSTKPFELIFVKPFQLQQFTKSSNYYTVLLGTPPFYSILLENHLTLSVDRAYSAGSPLPYELFNQCYLQYNTTIMQNYGSTETGCISLGDLFLVDNQVSGNPKHTFLLPGVNVKLLSSPSGCYLQNSKDSEIVVQTPWMGRGYVEHGSLRKFESFYRTFDVGTTWTCSIEDSDRISLIVRHRLRELFQVYIHGNLQMVQPEAIEQSLLQHPNVCNALVSHTDPSKIKAVVVLDVKESISDKDLLVWYQEKCTNSLPNLPLIIEIVEFLTCSAAGKILFW